MSECGKNRKEIKSSYFACVVFLAKQNEKPQRDQETIESLLNIKWEKYFQIN